MKKIIFAAFLILAFSVVYAHDWYGYINKTHADIMNEFGTPDWIDVCDTQSFHVKEDGNEGTSDFDVSFLYNKTGVMFQFDNQGSAKPYWKSEYVESVYPKIFGQNGILRVCGMYLFGTDEELPYGLKIGAGLADVLTNKLLGTPLKYTPDEVDFELQIKADTQERGIVEKEATRLNNDVHELVSVYMKDGKVSGVFIRQIHTISLTFR